MTLEQEFNRLRDEWDAEVRFQSSSTAIAEHPALQSIIALGRPVVPYIIADWEMHPDDPKHWFAALEAILGVPNAEVCYNQEGNIPAMVQSWLYWWYRNCTTEERTITGIASGGICYTPNGLPVTCWHASGLMTECESGDHPDYRFPVIAEYKGPPMGDDPCHEYGPEQLTVLYSDGYVVLALFEHCYTIWHLPKGSFLGGFRFDKHWKIREEDLVKIREAGLFMREKDTTLNNVVDQMAEDRRVFRALKTAAETAVHVWRSPSDRYEEQSAMLHLDKALKETDELPPVPETIRHPHVRKGQNSGV